MRRKKRDGLVIVTLRVFPQQKAQLEAMAAAQRVTLSEIGRQLLPAGIEQTHSGAGVRQDTPRAAAA